MLTKVLQTVKKHKLFSIGIIIALGGVGVFSVRALKSETPEIRYVLSQAEKATISTTITGSGQVSASQQVEIKAKASGEVTSLAIKKGQKVKTGANLLTINSGDAYEDVRDAQDNVESARLSLKKLQADADERSVFQAENALTAAQNTLEKLKLSQETEQAQSKESKEKALDDLTTAYEDIYSTLSETYLDIPDVMTDLEKIILSYEIRESESSFGSVIPNYDALVSTVRSSDTTEYGEIQIFADNTVNKFNTTDDEFDRLFTAFNSMSRSTDTSALEVMLTDSIAMLKKMSDTVKSELNLIDYWIDYRDTHDLDVFEIVEEYKTQLEQYTSTVNSNLSSLNTIEQKIKTSKQTVTNEERSLQEMELNNPFEITAAENDVKDKEMALQELNEGPDELELRQAQITLRQKQTALAKAQKELANYSVKAPFDGVVASVDAQKGESISSGGTVATLITEQQIAEISLNEVDVVQVEVGQQVMLTYDAIEDLEISGTVAEVDLIGTANQGVVSYTVTIVFDTQDERIKPGMSVSATIITEIKQDVITVPVGAVKTQGDISYVELVPDGAALGTTSMNGVTLANPPQQQIVEVGISNDTVTEIISGLAVGDYVVSRTITGTAGTGSTQTQSAPSLFGGGTGGTRQGFTGAPPSGGNVQILR
ncbi:MAG TPA: HlyD family efflux transporter periplasmic adaptor subunit [Candidatus Magasanikbacteria bacterium]|nr:HlyD family efflux transporter periplasmic adaptor subunit [Candidatus Magasanikbacteria bacterium]